MKENLNYTILIEKTGLDLNEDEVKVIETTHKENLPLIDINSLEHFIHECDYENVNWSKGHVAINNINRQLSKNGI